MKKDIKGRAIDVFAAEIRDIGGVFVLHKWCIDIIHIGELLLIDIK